MASASDPSRMHMGVVLAHWDGALPWMRLWTVEPDI